MGAEKIRFRLFYEEKKPMVIKPEGGGGRGWGGGKALMRPLREEFFAASLTNLILNLLKQIFDLCLL